ncbi:MAG: hypothetical protein IJE05_03960 [Clostridia bacterium]|nr:hypothetical protein [Clostridia bacterium]
MKKMENKKIEEKIDLLIKKISQEENIIKKYKNVINCKMLVAKLDRNIKLEELEEELKREKETNGITAKEEKKAIRDKNIEIREEIRKLRKELKSSVDHDFESSEALFSSNNVDKTIEIKNLQEQLKEQEDDLKNINKNLKKQNRKIAIEEKYLEVRKSRFNIFSKISDIIKGATSGIKEFFAERKENKKDDIEKMEKMNYIKDEYNAKKDEIKQNYEEQMAKLLNARYEMEKQIEEAYAKKTYKATEKDNLKSENIEDNSKYFKFRREDDIREEEPEKESKIKDKEKVAELENQDKDEDVSEVKDDVIDVYFFEKDKVDELCNEIQEMLGNVGNKKSKLDEKEIDDLCDDVKKTLKNAGSTYSNEPKDEYIDVDGMEL